MTTKRAILTGLASLTLFDVASATAADLGVKAPIVKAPVPVAPIYDWSGFYVGAHAGYRWADPELTSAPYTFSVPGSGPHTYAARDERYRANGGIVGGQAGYNVMLSPAILAGLEGDFSWGSAKSSRSTSFTIFDG